MLRLCLVWCLSGLCAHLAAALPLNTEDKVVPQARSHPCRKSNTTCGHPALSASSRNGHAPLDPSSSYGNLPLDHSSNFLNFLKKVHRRYPPGSQIFQERYQIFLKSIERHSYLNSLAFASNRTNVAYYGINQFSDLSVEEFSATYLRSYPTKNGSFGKRIKTSAQEKALPLRFDWREKKVVTPVKNQMSCGGCWAFSIVGAVESAYAIRGNLLEELSVQQVIDCSYKDYGCNGGSTLSAFNWLNQTRIKLVRNSKYTFKAHTGYCTYFPGSDFGVSIKGYEEYDFSGYEEEMMKMLIDLGPLAVIVDAVSWQDYLGGIIQHHCSSGEANHAVLVIGFDKTGDTPYWIVKNSWGTSWGIEGYVYIKMGGNVCGIAETVSAPFV
ncbi:cathepsin O [Ascaphus truei]|uniref:cathepsin O n=1 Tax=Ascaphus truei TaxID=8439 RepID=UPI003F596EB2